MEERDFTEIDVRMMLSRTDLLELGTREGRWNAETRHFGGKWRVVLEPDFETRRLTVITAFAVTGLKDA